MTNVDNTDRRILLSLVEEPRASNAGIAEKLGLARNTVQSRVAALEQNEVLRNYDRRLHAASIGYPLTVFMATHVDQPHVNAVVEALAAIPEVVQAHGLSGQADILLRLVCKDTDDLYRVNQAVLATEGVIRTETWLSMGELIPFRLSPLLQRDQEAGKQR
ncbi:Lrp/AsnC family transcriptional regulator [Agrococcus casei]|uniref:Transcriptional regulator, AsnC family n=1 Tax=Agrococcus casei LMG 22410 TaxID=1255656 RepID=A0A1R4GNZ7_9MICO|nr:Lrp/AsnC family transcriptional regulator [Agrococcus casei]SJM69918.1 Transcriptional regulator, AsnC family [Agrococcus casei LMG 22410]